KKISQFQTAIPLPEDDCWEDMEDEEVEWYTSDQTIIKNNEKILEWKRQHQERNQESRGGCKTWKEATVRDLYNELEYVSRMDPRKRDEYFTTNGWKFDLNSKTQ
ncbi:15831_t:CDS:1, partial [Funneliformis mosseae]